MGLALSCVAALCECGMCLACCGCKALCNCALSHVTRVAHVFLLITTFAFAAIIADYAAEDLDDNVPNINIDDTCSKGNDGTCLARQLFYRASLACVLVFTVLAVLSFPLDFVNRNLWPLKFMGTWGIFICFWFADNDTFRQYSEVARIISFVWLLVQSLLLVDLAHDLHDVLIAKADEVEKNGGDERGWKALYLLLTVGMFALGFTGLGFLYSDYAGCSDGQAIITITLIMGVVTTLLSLWDRVSMGILTPSIMFAYMVFLAWYALLSSPNESCNPTANDSASSEKKTAIAILTSISILVLLYLAGVGSRVLTIFNPEGTGVISGQAAPYSHAAGGANLRALVRGEPTPTDSAPATEQPRHDDDGGEKAGLCGGHVDHGPAGEESGAPQERTFFHVLMVLASIYGAMLLTNWGAPDGSPEEDSEDLAKVSLWLKATALFVTQILYLRILQVAYNNNAEE